MDLPTLCCIADIAATAAAVALYNVSLIGGIRRRVRCPSITKQLSVLGEEMVHSSVSK